ncbi:hypothetical protein [Nostoc sp.]|uniref:hypothetical protein n=1 Tax=Nostoc sp. TaxID=1180 RepID=UPI0011808AFF
MHTHLARLYPKLKTRFSLSGKNPGFLANTFYTSQIINEFKKVKLPFHKGFSLGVRATTPQEYRVAIKMDKVELKSDADTLLNT